MRVLVIDSALGACTVAMFEADRPLAIQSEIMARGHQERLGGQVRDVVAGAGGGFGAIDRIGVTVGPGSFTGLRVGIAFALGLGAALDRPVVGISTLVALTRSASGGGARIAALIDARRGQVYAQRFRNGAALAPPGVMALDAVHAMLAEDGPWRLVGSGASLLVESLPGATMEPLAAPSPEALAALTAAADPATAPPRPLYLRAPDATPPTRLPGQPRAAPV